MSPTDLFTRLSEPLTKLLGEKTAEKLSQELEIETLGQLLNYRPRKWLERGELTPISDLLPDQSATVVTSVTRVSPPRRISRGGSLTRISVGNGQLDLTFFNNRWIHTKLAPGDIVMVHGKVTSFKGQLQMTNPEIEVSDEEPDEESVVRGPEPIYPATAALASWRIKKAIGTALSSLEETDIPEILQEAELRKLGLPTLHEAFTQLHIPQDLQAANRAVRRLAFHEALMIQLALQERSENVVEKSAAAFSTDGLSIREQFDAQLPFALTAGQAAAGNTISAKMATTEPMNVLLQGEVGSGKTVVAVRAMLQAIQDKGQAALLAPTEVLAAQHARSLKTLLHDVKVPNKINTLDFEDQQAITITLLTGSMSGAAKKQALMDIATGTSDIVIGTHALLSEHVKFHHLGLVVVDEQHRFGVAQRAALRERNEPIPHLLVMSATPIPRSIALTAFGDLELVELPGVPANRAPVTSHVVNMGASPQQIIRVWKTLLAAVQEGRQGYIICPKINPTTVEGTHPVKLGEQDLARQHDAAVEVLYARLKELDMFKNVRLGLLHGQLAAAEKDRVMRAFESHEIDIVISTTVVEVGVDVPNATVMAVLDADSFGISTLHQLRGRIRRSEHPGTFLLVHRRDESDANNSDTIRRLNIVANHTDGMTLAIEDLHLRKEGDILGLDQSGRGSSLKYLRLLKDQDLIESAHDVAQDILAGDHDRLPTSDLYHWVRLWKQDYSADYLQHG